VSEETERAGSGPKGSGAGIDPTALAVAGAGAGRWMRFPKISKSRSQPHAIQAMNRSPGWSRLHPSWDGPLLYRDPGPAFKSQKVMESLNFKGGSYVQDNSD
jgi:hypothetical protein